MSENTEMVCRAVLVSFALELGISFVSKKNLFKIASYGLLSSEEEKWRQTLIVACFHPLAQIWLPELLFCWVFLEWRVDLCSIIRITQA